LEDKRRTGTFPRRNGKNREIRPQGTEDLKEGGEKPETNEERDRRIDQAIDAEEIIRLHQEKADLETKIEELKEKLEEEEQKTKKEEEGKNELEKTLEETRRAWRWEYSMKKVVGQDVENLRKTLMEERKEHTEKEDKMREGRTNLGVEVLRLRNMAEILCQRIAAGEFSGA
jgi:superfamily II DNA helicase RecQ